VGKKISKPQADLHKLTKSKSVMLCPVLPYIPSEKKADVVSNLKAEVNLLQSQHPEDHMQTR